MCAEFTHLLMLSKRMQQKNSDPVLAGDVRSTIPRRSVSVLTFPREMTGISRSFLRLTERSSVG
jgi:hypothetical protein